MRCTAVDDSCTDMELSDALIELTIPSDPLIAVYSLEDIPSRLIAQQLTHRDAVRNADAGLTMQIHYLY